MKRRLQNKDNLWVWNQFLDSLSRRETNGKLLDIKGSIRFEGVSFTYPETQIRAINKLSFSISEGETLGIIGKVGSGKSSLLNLINRLYDPDQGEIFLDGNDIKKFKLEKLRGAIGNVPQNPFLFSETIEDNIRFGKMNASEEEIVEAAKNAAVHKSIVKFKEGYKTLLGERGLTLSGGQIQRVSIARALIKDPKILLFDDCLSAVDADTEEKILKNLKAYCKDKTTIIVSHRISSVKDADQILVLDKGEILEQGNHQKLIKSKGLYFDLFNKQQDELNN